MYYLLNYDYVSDILERREAFRAGHLNLLSGYQECGELILAGATGNPVTGACFVFKVESETIVQDFITQDPYVANGLVTNTSIAPWTVVIGSAYNT